MVLYGYNVTGVYGENDIFLKKCPFSKKITLPKILDCLENETNELIMDNETIEKARKSVERMAEIGR